MMKLTVGSLWQFLLAKPMLFTPHSSITLSNTDIVLILSTNRDSTSYIPVLVGDVVGSIHYEWFDDHATKIG